MNSVALTLVLATVGRTSEVGRLLDSLLDQTDKDFELVVVDQNTDDRLVLALAKARCAGLSIAHLRMDRPNQGDARNLGMAKARGQVIAFPDDDCWYEPNVVESVLGAFCSHPNWAGVVAQWVEQAEVLPPEKMASPVLELSAWRGFRAGGASCISLFFRTDVLRHLGGFDNRLGLGHWFGAGEETDLLLRVLGSGSVIGRWTEARVHHHFAVSARDRSYVNWRVAMTRSRGTGALFVKHRVPWHVFVRGFLAPPLKAAMNGEGMKGVGIGLAASLGRIQGALKWLFTER